MTLGVTFFIVAFLVIAIWLVIEFKRLKHKVFALFLMGLILFTYFSFTASLKGQDTDFTSISGVLDVGKLYFSWVAGIFGNFKSITAYAFKQNWNKTNTTIMKKTEKEMDSIWERLE